MKKKPKAPPIPLEKDIVKAICDVLDIAVKQGRVYYFRTHGNLGNLIPDRPGIPDIFGGVTETAPVCSMTPVPFGIEVKRTDGRASVYNNSLDQGFPITDYLVINGRPRKVPDRDRDQFNELVDIRKIGGIAFFADDPMTVIERLDLGFEMK